MRIGIPKETKEGEARVALTPDCVMELCKHGHTIFIESYAGMKSGFYNGEYLNAGACVMHCNEDVYKESELLVKVKEPIPDEYPFIAHLKNKALFSYLHLASNIELTRFLLCNMIKGIAYETVEDSNGRLVLLEPMSHIAGNLAVSKAIWHMETGKRSLMGIPNVEPAGIVIVGGGTVGRTAAKRASSLGAKVTLFERDQKKVKKLSEELEAVDVLISEEKSLTAHLEDADVLIGAVYVSGARAPLVVNQEMVRRMKKGALIIDVAIDQGGCIYGARPTTHNDPVYNLEGKVFCCIANMPAAVAHDASIALSRSILPYVLNIANKGVEGLANEDKGFAKGIMTYKGYITHEKVAEAMGGSYTPLEVWYVAKEIHDLKGGYQQYKPLEELL